MYPVIRSLLVVLLVAGFTGCAALRDGNAAGDRPVVHVVVCWMKDPKDASASARMIEASHRFRQIPGVRDVYVGPALSPSGGPRPQQAPFDLAVTMIFENQQALAAYQQHPMHKEAVRNTLLPLVKRFVVYDYFADRAPGR